VPHPAGSGDRGLHQLFAAEMLLPSPNRNAASSPELAAHPIQLEVELPGQVEELDQRHAGAAAHSSHQGGVGARWDIEDDGGIAAIARRQTILRELVRLATGSEVVVGPDRRRGESRRPDRPGRPVAPLPVAACWRSGGFALVSARTTAIGWTRRQTESAAKAPPARWRSSGHDGKRQKRRPFFDQGRIYS